MSQIFLPKQCNIQSNHLTESHSYHSRRLHLQGELPTFPLFHANVITCCHHFIWSCPCHLLLHALVSAVYSTSTFQILACLTCKISSLVVVEWADRTLFLVSGLLMKLLGWSLVCTVIALILVLLVKARPACLWYFPYYLAWTILFCIYFFPAFKISIWNHSDLDLVTCFKRISLREPCVR